MHVNQILSDFVIKHNLEFEDGEPIGINYNDTELKEKELTFLEHVKYFDNTEIYYKTNFK